jgi:putative FmdB family regulatory protein
MPIYEFECAKCQEVFEAMRSVSDDESTSCPACGSTRVTKLVSAFGISKPGLKLGTLSPVERSRAEKAIRRVSRGRCCDTFCDPPGS